MRRALSLVVVLSMSASAVAAPEKAACLAAHESAQKLRSENKLRAAREKLLVCAVDACPSLVKVDCTKWLPEVDRDLPSVIVRATDEKGADVVDVKVELDGAVVATSLDGKPVTVDPGAHNLELTHAGSPRIKRQIVVAAGEKNRVIEVEFESPDVAEKPEEPKKTGTDPLPWILTGVGAVGIVGFAVLGITTRARISELRGSCAPTCDPSEESSLRTRLILADVSLGIGLVSLGAATYLFLRPTPSTAVALTPMPNGGFANFHASF